MASEIRLLHSISHGFASRSRCELDQELLIALSRRERTFYAVADIGVLVLVVLSPFVHVSNVDGIASKNPYPNEMQVAEWFNTQNLKPDERVATFSTCSYPLNTVSNNWQLDGGYIQGVTNLDFYYKYWITLSVLQSNFGGYPICLEYILVLYSQ